MEIGQFPNDFKNKIKGAANDPRFFATGISVVAHMFSPFIPAAHFNSRFIVTKDAWFGGGCDLTPTYDEKKVKNLFHKSLKTFCDKYDKNYYKKFSKWCSEYFFLKHRNEERGIGGIFFDYLNAKSVKNFKQINCFSNEGDKWRNSDISFDENYILTIKIAEKFIGERGRINCSLREKSGFWRWLGVQYVISEK